MQTLKVQQLLKCAEEYACVALKEKKLQILLFFRW